MSIGLPALDSAPANTATARFRFTLWELFVLTTLVCVSGGLLAWVIRGEPIAILLLLSAGFGTIAYLIHVITRWAVGNVVATTGLLCLFGCCLLSPVSRMPPSSSRKISCSNNLHNLALALMQYEVSFGTLPPAYIAEEQGKPMHSWRVLLLPYLEQNNLYKRYRFDELAV